MTSLNLIRGDHWGSVEIQTPKSKSTLRPQECKGIEQRDCAVYHVGGEHITANVDPLEH